MTEREEVTAAQIEIAPIPLPVEEVRRCLGRLADYAMHLDRMLAGEGTPGDLATGAAALHEATDELVAALSGEPQDRPRGNYIDRDAMPDHPYYNAITDDFEVVEPLHPENALHFYIISDRHIYCEETGKVCALKGDALFLISAFLKTQQRPVRAAVHRAFGFRESEKRSATQSRFRYAMDILQAELMVIVPEGIVPITVLRSSSQTTRMINPDIVVVDKRGDEAYAQFVPPSPPDGQPDVSDLPRVRDNIELARKNMLPGYRRIVGLLREVSEHGVHYDLPRAVQVLRAAGLRPQRLDVDWRLTTRGGVWCVEGEAGVRALLAAAGVEMPEPAAEPVAATAEAQPVPVPVAPPPAEAEPPAPKGAEVELKITGNTLASIVAFLNATETDAEERPYTEAELSLAVTMAVQYLDANLQRHGIYSHYGASKVIAAAKQARGNA